MSRPKRKLDPATMTVEEADHLLTGFSFDGGSPFDSPEARRAAWRANREDLVLYWMGRSVELDVSGELFWGSGPEGPGHRPRAWWQYEAPERRKLVDPDRLREFVQARASQEAAEKAVEMARSWDGPTYLGAPTLTPQNWSFQGFETQAEYLDRLDLLTSWEREQIELD